jgi:cob(I)alamin adenosyltransferase
MRPNPLIPTGIGAEAAAVEEKARAPERRVLERSMVELESGDVEKASCMYFLNWIQ